MLRYRVTRALALGLRHIQAAAQVAANASSDAALSAGLKAKQAAYRSLEAIEAKALKEVDMANVGIEAAYNRLGAAVEKYDDTMSEIKDRRFDIEREVL